MRTTSTTTGSPPSSRSADRDGPALAARTDLRNPCVSCVFRRSPRSGTRRCHPRGYPAPVLGSSRPRACRASPAHRRRARAQFDAGRSTRHEPRERYDPGLHASRPSGTESWQDRRRGHARGGDRARRATQRPVRAPAADLVPPRAASRSSTPPMTRNRPRSNASPFIDRLAHEPRPVSCRRHEPPSVHRPRPADREGLSSPSTPATTRMAADDSLTELAALATTRARRRRGRGMAEPAPRRPQLVRARARPRSSARLRARRGSTCSSPTTSSRPARRRRSRACSTSRSSTAAG